MYLISACLIGENVKYDGGNNLHSLARSLYESGQAIPVCPEVLGGLSIPRVPSEMVGSRVIAADGTDVTAQFHRGAEQTLALAKKHHIKTAILQARSPSCGSQTVYDGSFSGRLIPGQGITTRLLEAHGIEVITIDEFARRQSEK